MIVSKRPTRSAALAAVPGTSAGCGSAPSVLSTPSPSFGAHTLLNKSTTKVVGRRRDFRLWPGLGSRS
jgi:hypothetical protein